MLVFSWNYGRLGNRANVAGTGTSLCRVMIDEWQIGSRDRPNAGGSGMRCIPYRKDVRKVLRIAYGNKLSRQGTRAWVK
jgi:hypothetical protein